MARTVHAKIFWSGGSQAVRLPKEMRLPGDEVLVRRRGNVVELQALPGRDDWGGFWERMQPLRSLRRWKTGPATRREPL